MVPLLVSKSLSSSLWAATVDELIGKKAQWFAVAPNAGWANRITSILRRVGHRGGERLLASLLNGVCGYLRLTRVVIERLHVDGALMRHDLAIDAEHTNVPSVGATHHNSKGTPHF